ncbi:hypothetical protein NN561_001738 [Cricetulus griseus]
MARVAWCPRGHFHAVKGNPIHSRKSGRRAAGKRSWEGTATEPEASSPKAPKCFCPPPPPTLHSDPRQALKFAVWWAESGFPRAHGEVGQRRACCWVGVPLAQLSAKPGGVPQILGSAEAFEEVGC